MRAGTAPRNLGQQVLSAAERHGEHVAFQIRRGFRIQRFTFAETGTFARRIAWWLESKGLQPGDCIAVWSPNMPEYALLYFGAWLAGAAVVPIDLRTRPEVRNRFARHAGARLGFKSELLDDRFGTPVVETLALKGLFDHVAEPPPGWEPPEVSQAGRDRLPLGHHRHPEGRHARPRQPLGSDRGVDRRLPAPPDYRALSLLPLSHVYEQVVDL